MTLRQQNDPISFVQTEDLTTRIAGAMGELIKDDYADKALLWTELATREHEAKDIDIRDNCDGCSCDGDCPATCCEGEVSRFASFAGVA